MGPEPLDIHPRVYRALTSPVNGNLDPAYLKILDRNGEFLRSGFRTRNKITNTTPGTGTSGMEACVANLMEPGDKVLVCVHGYLGDRARQMAARQGAKVTVIEGEWGKSTDPQKGPV
jgi:alanine-glyoxylate transaminase/serine-glyoxylate transaminase/serine-pyruvate transaminase